MCMNNRLVKLLLALVLVATLLPVTPAFAVSDARAQALAYQKHSLGLTGVENARDLGGYRTKDGRTVKFGKLFRTGELTD
ncbi:MAG: tyrosine-protein phosphatase, partial [Clostridia bacterium]|nr:tyrosine-protein phosphatase [Clostridia bacterium]